MNGAGVRQRGVFALWLVVLLPALIALFALLLESTYLFAVRHRQQTATDAAALGGAYQILRHDEDGMAVAAGYAAAVNGFPSGAETTLDIAHPPLDGAYAGGDLAVRARIEHQPVRLLAAVVPGMQPLIGTSATAGFRRATCLHTLAPATAESLNVAADAVVDGPFCSAQVNSNAASALRIRNRARVTLLDLRVAGSASVHASASVTPTPVTGVAATPDPLLALPAPAVGACDYNNRVVNGTVALSPGTYCGGLRINASGRANLAPGNYIIVGGILDLRNLATIAGNNVTLFLMQGAYMQMNASATVILTAASTGTYAGMVFFESRTAPLDTATHTLPMTTNALIEGIVYLPRSKLSLTSSTPTPANASARNLVLIARNISLGGRIRINVDPSLVPEALRSRAWLIE